MITATFTIDYMTNVAAQGLFYALSTSSTSLDVNEAKICIIYHKVVL